ncbi:MAG: NYN domain-containing protein [Clostridia bacterium]|nr:NYN domain-containing protein [Clostridia bacterium]
MGDDAELYIESGGDPTTLIPWDYDDYYYFDDDDYDEFDDEDYSLEAILPSKKKNTMVFIDAENISSDHCSSIIDQCKTIGEVFEVRYYARQKDPSTAKWKETITDYGLKPILMCGEPERNKIDNKIIKDIRKVLNTNKSIDIFCIASKDGDYSKIVQEIRDNKKRAVILATKGTSKKLKSKASEIKGI